jgi:hypothetical protein
MINKRIIDLYSELSLLGRDLDRHASFYVKCAVTQEDSVSCKNCLLSGPDVIKNLVSKIERIEKCAAKEADDQATEGHSRIS